MLKGEYFSKSSLALLNLVNVATETVILFTTQIAFHSA